MWTNANDLQTDTFARKDSAVAGCVEEARPASLRTYRPALSYLFGSLARQVTYPLRMPRGPKRTRRQPAQRTCGRDESRLGGFLGLSSPTCAQRRGTAQPDLPRY